MMNSLNNEHGEEIMSLSANQWNQTKSKIKTTFRRLSDLEIEGLRNHMDQLPRTVQKVYGYGIIETEQKCKAFNEYLRNG